MNKVLAVGIDPARQVNYGVAMVYPEKILLSRSFPNTWMGVMSFCKEVCRIAKERNLAITYGVEGGKNTASCLCQILFLRGNGDIREINPLKANRQKDFYGEDKSDEVDARACAAIVLRAKENLPLMEITSSLGNDIRETERHLTELAWRKTKLLNKLHYELCQVYMASYKDLFPKLKSRRALRFFERYPVPQMLKEETQDNLLQFLLEDRRQGPFPQHEVYRQLKKKAKLMLEVGRSLGTLPFDRAVRIKQEIISQLCRELLVLQKDMARVDKLLEKELLPRTGMKLTSFPGMDIRLASVIIGESGNPHRFRKASSYAAYNGTAPKEKGSGGRSRHKARKACNKRLKRAFFLLALASMRHDTLSRGYVEHCRRKGISKRESVKRLARRLSDVVYAMMRDKTVYDRDKVDTDP